MVKKIGAMIKQMRLEAGVLQKVLGEGLTSTSGLSRIERGEAEQDSFLLSALIQRLGKSMDRFEMTVSNDEYKLILLRAFLQESMSNDNLEEAIIQLNEYEKIYLGMRSKRQELHKQYVKLLRGTIAYLQTGEKEEFLDCLEDVILLTCPKWEDGNWNVIFLCEQEMQILLVLAYMYMENGKVKYAAEMLNNLKEYIETRITSEEAKVRVYSKCCYLLAHAYKELGNSEKAVEICDKGLEYLSGNGCITFLEELLALSLECRKDEKKERVLQALLFMYELVGYHHGEKIILKLLFLVGHPEIILSNELLKEVRSLKDWSQEKLADDICYRETISKIENGRTAQKKILKQLLAKMGVERDAYFASVIADDYETYEMVRKFKRSVYTGNRSDKLEKLKEIEQRIDMDSVVNRQFVEAHRIIYSGMEKEIGYEKTIEKLIECLKLTMPEFDGNIYRVPSVEEVFILNNIALRLKRNGRKFEAMALYRQIIAKYRKSKVSSENHAYSLAPIYLNYAGLLEECNYLKKAEKIGKDGMMRMLKVQRGESSAMYLCNLTCVYMKQRTQVRDKRIEDCGNNSYSLLKFFKCNNYCTMAKQYYEENYGPLLVEE